MLLSIPHVCTIALLKIPQKFSVFRPCLNPAQQKISSLLSSSFERKIQHAPVSREKILICNLGNVSYNIAVLEMVYAPISLPNNIEEIPIGGRPNKIIEDLFDNWYRV
ncbi:hypothetical protein V2J09_005954 [Rumex salicifolius]